MAKGFASMDPEKRRAIASAGGKAAHAQGKAHRFTHEEAKAAGSKGGKAVSRDLAHMAEIGRKGGRRKQPAAEVSTSELPVIEVVLED
jgi:uncharacterized protein